MAARYLLDANICIYLLSERRPDISRRLERSGPGRVAISTIVWGELHFGLAKSARRADGLLRLEALREIAPVLDLPQEAAAIYGELRATLERGGTSIGNNDLWIAAHARASGLILVSNNTREFERVPGLKLDNWAK